MGSYTYHHKKPGRRCIYPFVYSWVDSEGCASLEHDTLLENMHGLTFELSVAIFYLIIYQLMQLRIFIYLAFIHVSKWIKLIYLFILIINGVILASPREYLKHSMSICLYTFWRNVALYAIPQFLMEKLHK